MHILIFNLRALFSHGESSFVPLSIILVTLLPLCL